ncbi:MAG: outer membrane protein assembly factor [Acidobacteriota bacterium]
MLLALVAACGGTPVHHPGEEFLQAIKFEGNHAISSDDLRAGLALRRAQQMGASPDPYLVGVDRERVRGMYMRRGYLEVDVHSRVERHGEAATVIYRIDEGPRARTHVVITGLPNDPAVTEQKVRDVLPLQEGQLFSYEPYDKAKEPLLALVEDAGYAHARLDAKVIVDRSKHEAIVQLAYDPGVKCRFGTITVSGAPPSLDDAVRQRLRFDTGDQFSTSALAASQRAIYAMRRFSTVQIVPDKTDGDVVDVRVAVHESAVHEVSLGGGFGIDPATYEVRGRAGYSVLGWPFPLYDVTLDTRPAYAVLRDGSGYQPRVRALATLRRIDLFAPFVTGELQGGYDYLVVEAYTMFGPRIGLGVTSPLGIDELQLRVGWELERLDFRNLSPVIDMMTAHELGLDTYERLGEYQQTLSLDLRDSPIEPHRGIYGEVRVNEGTPYAAGAFSFVQVTPELRTYVPINDDLVLAARARAGNFYGDIPVSERYFSGGATTQRGFSERRLAPTLFSYNSKGQLIYEPIGGGGLFESNLELRSRLGTIKHMGVGGVVFLDGADVREHIQDINFGNLHWAAGAGLRLYTIIGAVRFDFGYRLDRTGPMEPEPNSHYAFHLSIGEAY